MFKILSSAINDFSLSFKTIASSVDKSTHLRDNLAFALLQSMAYEYTKTNYDLCINGSFDML